MRSRVVALLLLLVGALALAADTVAVGATVSGTSVASAVADELTDSTEVRVTKMTCPEEIVLQKGRTFTCQGRFESGDKTPVRVTLTNAQGGFRARIVNLLVRHLEDQLEAAITSVQTSVTCPKERKVKKGDRFTCKIRAAGGAKGTFKITQTGDGLVRYEQA